MGGGGGWIGWEKEEEVDKMGEGGGWIGWEKEEVG